MGASGDRSPPVDRVAEIRAEIEAARARIAGTLEALRFKTDVPARLGDSVGNAAATFTAHVIERVTSAQADKDAADEEATTIAVRAETVTETVDEGTG